MTNEDAKKELKNLSGLFTNATEDQFNSFNGINMYKAKIIFSTKIFDVLDYAINVLEKNEQYRWHDLCKNPDDLPKDHEIVLMCLKGFNPSVVGVVMGIHNKRRGLWRTNITTYHDNDVIAWREIEPFEGECE